MSEGTRQAISLLFRAAGSRAATWGVVLATLVLAAGCDAKSLKSARKEFYAGQYDQAGRTLDGTSPPKRDRLLYLVERGTMLHVAGQYSDSNRAFLAAAELSRDLETLSITRFSTSLAINERLQAYGGEGFERVLIHAYLAMNFLLLNDFENALVEAKRVLQTIQESEENYDSQPFPHYLVGLCYELLGAYQDASLEYQKVQRSGVDYPGIKRDLLRMAERLGLDVEREEWLKLPGPVPEKDDRTSELILFIQTGRGPTKISKGIFVPPSHRITVPAYTGQSGRVDHGDVSLGEQVLGRSYRLLDVDVVARASLDRRMKKIVAKEIARRGVQEVIARQSDNVPVEVLVRIAFFALARADTRCWHSLPRDFQIARIPMKPGTGDVRVTFVDSSGGTVSSTVMERVEVSDSRPAFRSLRVLE